MPLRKDLNVFPTNMLYFQDGELFKMLSMALICPKSQSHISLMSVSQSIVPFLVAAGTSCQGPRCSRSFPGCDGEQGDGGCCDAPAQPELGMSVTFTAQGGLGESNANS